MTADDLNKHLSLSISSICGNGYTDPDDNHCAHFVSHVMSFQFGTTCRSMKTGTQPGANIRVQELFAKCPEVGKWTDRPLLQTNCLVFVTELSNVEVKKKVMANVPKKHVGIFLDGKIWHYSNSKSKVVCVSPGEFQHHYPGKNIALFYGSLPTT